MPHDTWSPRRFASPWVLCILCVSCCLAGCTRSAPNGGVDTRTPVPPQAVAPPEDPSYLPEEDDDLASFADTSCRSGYSGGGAPLRGLSYQPPPEEQSASHTFSADAVEITVAILVDGREVPFDYRFKTGDAIQFKVRSNRDAMLEVYHREAAHPYQRLWPTFSSAPGVNRVRAKRPQLIPKKGALIFDDNVGTEFLAIKVDRVRGPARKKTSGGKPAPQVAEAPSRAEPGAEAPIVNMIVRTVKRGLRVVPDPVSAETHILAGTDAEGVAAFEFQLCHVAN